MFGKRRRGQADSQWPMTTTQETQVFPWSEDESSIACNLAFANLANNLPAWLNIDGRVHAETYVAAVGAIAGFAAQCSLRATMTPEAAAELMMVTTSAGDRFLYGAPIANMLTADRPEDVASRVWPRASGGAIAAGLSVEKVPDCGPMFAHVAASLGGPSEGLPSVPANHQPHATGRELMRDLWPRAVAFLKADFDDFHKRFGPVPMGRWGAIAACCCARPIVDVKAVLPPEIALTILMETAIYTSKLDPQSVE